MSAREIVANILHEEIDFSHMDHHSGKCDICLMNADRILNAIAPYKPDDRFADREVFRLEEELRMKEEACQKSY